MSGIAADPEPDLRGRLVRRLGTLREMLDSKTHKRAPLEDLRRRHWRVRIEYFPSYAPELNPDEGDWSLSNKRAPANSQPAAVAQLMERIIEAIDGIGSSPEKLSGCICNRNFPLFALTFPLFTQRSITRS